MSDNFIGTNCYCFLNNVFETSFSIVPDYFTVNIITALIVAAFLTTPSEEMPFWGFKVHKS